MRRVVTGQDAEGRSIFVSDTDIEPIVVSLLPGAEFYRMWGADTPPRLPSDGTPPNQPGYFPPPGGYRFGFFTLAPESMALREGLDFTAGFAELSAKLPGIAEVMELDQPGMHTIDTVDFAVVISGECWLEVDGGAETHLRAGDSVVQNGARHAWSNRGTTPCVLFVCLLGAARAER